MRIVVLAIIAAYALFSASLVVGTWNVAGSIFGWNLGPDGKTLIAVTRGRPAALSGIREGDKIDWRSLPLVGRVNLGLVQAVGTNATLRVNVDHDGKSRAVLLHAEPWGKNVERGARLFTLAGVFLLAIGIGLVMLRPSRMTWGFLCSSLIQVYPSYAYIWAQQSATNFLVALTGFALILGITVAGVLIFMSRFPADTPRGPLVFLDKYAIPLGIAVAVLALYVAFATLWSSTPPNAVAVFLYEYGVRAAVFAVALGALVTTFVLTSGSDRQRVIPVLVSYAAYVAIAAIAELYFARYTQPRETALLYAAQNVSTIALAIAIANGVIRHRVIDVSFAISRTLVYTIMTTIVVGAFALVDFVSSKFLEQFRIAFLLEAVVALALGLSLNALHSRVDKTIDRLFFRRRHLAQARLERVSVILAHAESPDFIDQALIDEPRDALELLSGAVFRVSGKSRYRRVASFGWNADDVSNIDETDALIVHLRAELQPVELRAMRWPHANVPHGGAEPLVALPLAVRHDVLGFALYSGHRGGEALDPDEMSVLKHLADCAAGAYDHIDAQALKRRLRQTEAENAKLRHGEELVRGMLDVLKRDPRTLEAKRFLRPYCGDRMQFNIVRGGAALPVLVIEIAVARYGH